MLEHAMSHLMFLSVITPYILYMSVFIKENIMNALRDAFVFFFAKVIVVELRDLAKSF